MPDRRPTLGETDPLPSTRPRRIDMAGRESTSTIVIESGGVKSLSELLHNRRRTIVITDRNVARFHGDCFADWPVLVVEPGEASKSLAVAEHLYRDLIRLEADRDTFVLGFGGGIVCDLAGFVATTYMRGVPFGFVATSLLAQVDASVGGKNGVNLDRYKNIVGTFSQPEFVICDPHVLNTLPMPELQCGFAEIVKHMFIADEPMLTWFEGRAQKALALDEETISAVVEHSVRTKAAIVNRDEREKGERRKLNFGHTLGHAVERINGVPHGEAVAVGMVAAANISKRLDLLTRADVNRIIQILERIHLPVRLNAPADQLLEAMRKDKKRAGSSVHFVLLDGIGRAVVREISFDALESVLRDMEREGHAGQ